tara:strand:+ start:996 stop:1175 length:180 start_codon:yes stop_codon:yes gene_type:complete
MFLHHQDSGSGVQQRSSHFPLPKSEDFLAFLKDWRQEAAAGHGMKFQIAGERKCLTFIP